MAGDFVAVSGPEKTGRSFRCRKAVAGWGRLLGVFPAQHSVEELLQYGDEAGMHGLSRFLIHAVAERGERTRRVGIGAGA